MYPCWMPKPLREPGRFYIKLLPNDNKREAHHWENEKAYNNSKRLKVLDILHVHNYNKD